MNKLNEAINNAIDNLDTYVLNEGAFKNRQLKFDVKVDDGSWEVAEDGGKLKVSCIFTLNNNPYEAHITYNYDDSDKEYVSDKDATVVTNLEGYDCSKLLKTYVNLYWEFMAQMPQDVIDDINKMAKERSE